MPKRVQRLQRQHHVQKDGIGEVDDGVGRLKRWLTHSCRWIAVYNIQYTIQQIAFSTVQAETGSSNGVEGWGMRDFFIVGGAKAGKLFGLSGEDPVNGDC